MQRNMTLRTPAGASLSPFSILSFSAPRPLHGRGQGGLACLPAIAPALQRTPRRDYGMVAILMLVADARAVRMPTSQRFGNTDFPKAIDLFWEEAAKTTPGRLS
jgi:hypothetical protein